ncbi:MAG: IS66 family insertion sequence element accessory protein TnpB [Enterococcus avium]
MDVFDQALFLFCGTKSDRFKALYWEAIFFVIQHFETISSAATK